MNIKVKDNDFSRSKFQDTKYEKETYRTYKIILARCYGDIILVGMNHEADAIAQ